MLYWAKRKQNSGKAFDFLVSNAVPGNKCQLLTTRRELAINAAKEDWDYLDSSLNGEIYKTYDLVKCPEGTEITGDEEAFKH